MNQNIKKPSFLLHITEVFRAIFQAIKAWFFMRTYAYQNIGKGQIVMVVPGLMGTDLSTKMLRSFLNKMGFRTFGWEMGRNKGRFADLPRLIEKIKNLHEGSGQKIVLIGWSMGGIFAREVSKQIPQAIKQLITMGSPFGNIHAPNNAKWVFDLLNPERKVMPEFENQIHQPANVPTLAIYSISDGIVPWEACIEPLEDDLHQNKEVESSHFGMGTNKEVFKVVLERLKG
ncbi:MAG: putative esterase [Arcticibacterium sp.]|jgi:predicted esterase